VDIEKWPGPALARISGNQGGAHFAVTALNDAGESLDLLVNTVEPYSGTRPLDFTDGAHTARFEVAATGDWQIEVLPVIGNIEVVDVPGTATGTGDNVIALGDPADVATITGNSAASHFAVIGYGGLFSDLLVNTTDPYEGQVIISEDTFLLAITAVGDWSIELTAR
jgi:hypothetical protein